MTKREKLEKEIQECLDDFKEYDINYIGLLMCDLYLINYCGRITIEIESRVKTRIATLQQLKALGLLKKEMERK